MFRLIIIWIGKIFLLASRFRGGGSALPGLVVEKLSPRFLETCVSGFGRTVLIAGTNGKTTTTKMVRHILINDKQKVLNNSAGSNMPRGIISAILADMDWRGRFYADTGLFEVDEGFIADLASVFRPEAILVLNLLRDQLDRYGELSRTAQLIAESLPYSKTAILNADDPMVAELADTANKTVYFGAKPHIRAQVPHDDALHQVDNINLDHTIDKADIQILRSDRTKQGQQVELDINGHKIGFELKFGGVFNAYNAAASVAAAFVMGVDIEKASHALSKVSPAFGRSERIEIGGKSILLLLVKNPSGFNQIITTYLKDNSDAPVLIAINDNYADGRDVSWLWDANIEDLGRINKKFVVTGTRGYDMALRLQYADITSSTELDPAAAIEEFLDLIPIGGEGYIVPTYTAMLEIRKILASKTKLPKVNA